MNLPGHPEVFVVSNALKDGKPIGLKRAGEGYHTDGEDKRFPNAGSFLYAIEVPPEEGDTIFVDMYAVHDALPADMRRALEGRRARFSRIDLHDVHYPLMPALTEAQKLDRPDVWHPLLRRHPRTGRTSLVHRSLGLRHRGHAAPGGPSADHGTSGLRATASVPVSPSLAGRRCDPVGQSLHPAPRHRVQR